MLLSVSLGMAACGSGDSDADSGVGGAPSGGASGDGDSGGSNGDGDGDGTTGGASGDGDGDMAGSSGDGDGDSGGSNGDGDGDTGGVAGDGDGDTGGAAGDGDGDGDTGGSGGMATGGSTGQLNFTVSRAGLLDGTSTGWEEARDVAFDDAGNIYVVGGTSAPDFPTTPGAFDETYNTGGSGLGSQGDTDAFVTKIDPSGAIVWSTYLGGPNYDRAYAVEVDAQGFVFVAGRAGDGFPVTTGVLQETFAGDSREQGAYGDQDGFVSKLSPDGGSLVWSTYFGASESGFIRDMDVDGAGRVHVAATAVSGDMSAHVTVDAAQPTLNGAFDSFYARISADGSAVEYGTYFGGVETGGYYSGNPSVRVLPDGTAFVHAMEPGVGAPTTAGVVQPDSGGSVDFLIAKFLPGGTMEWCSYLGGSDFEGMDTHTLAIDPQGNPVLSGATTSVNYPTTDGTSVNGSESDFVVTRLSSDGTTILDSTVGGGTMGESIEGIWIPASGDIYFSGQTFSDNLPVTSNALVSTYIGERSGMMGVLSADFSELRYLSYDGIPGEYADRSTAVADDGTWAIVGASWKIDPFPSVPSSNDSHLDGQAGAFFTVLSPVP